MTYPELFAAMSAQVQAKLHQFGGGHDFDHTLRVLHNARRLAQNFPAAQLEVVELAALLHDIARPEEDAAQGKCCHAQLGAVMAREWLQAAGAPEELTAQVEYAIAHHRFRSGKRPVTLEAQILFDADKLDSLGAVGLGRAFLFAGRCGARVHNTAEVALHSPPYSREDTAYREYLVKLRDLPEQMLTAPGRQEAQQRREFMREFFDRLDTECQID